MELRHLHYFVAVAEHLSMSRAAERLHTTEPSLGRQIRQLEAFVGVPLLNRRKHKWELTEAGKVLLTEARSALRGLDSMVETVQHVGYEEAGRIVAAFSPGAASAVLSRLLPLLKARYPEIKLVLKSLGSAEQVPAIKSRTISVGFLRGPVNDRGIASETIRRDRMMALVPREHPLARLRRVPPAALVQLPLILSRFFRDDVSSIATRAGVAFRTILETDHVLPTLSAVGAGLGFGLLPDHYEQILPKSVIARPLALAPPPTVDLVVAYRAGESVPALAPLLSAVRECFGKAKKLPGGGRGQGGSPPPR